MKSKLILCKLNVTKQHFTIGGLNNKKYIPRNFSMFKCEKTQVQKKNQCGEIENKFKVTRERDGADSNKLGDWDGIYTLLCIKQITNKSLLYDTGNSTQYSVMTYMGKKFLKSGYMYTYN